MRWLAGIDEAGYGPNLGPLVQAAVAIRVQDDACPWEKLSRAVRRADEPADGRLVVDDSKRVYAGKNFEALELSALATSGLEPHAVRTICAPEAEPCRTDGDETLPGEDRQAVRQARVNFGRALCSAGMKFRMIDVLVTPASEINAAIAEHGTKAAAALSGLGRLLRKTLIDVPRGDLTIVIDRQGGRQYYSAFLSDTFPDAWPETVAERPDLSWYRLTTNGRVIDVRFEVRADSRHFSVAAASIIAKYVRERCMASFNRFWMERLPGLAPTAGYPVDARRFFEQIRPTCRVLGIAEDAVWRVK